MMSAVPDNRLATATSYRDDGPTASHASSGLEPHPEVARVLRFLDQHCLLRQATVVWRLLQFLELGDIHAILYSCRYAARCAPRVTLPRPRTSFLVQTGAAPHPAHLAAASRWGEYRLPMPMHLTCVRDSVRRAAGDETENGFAQLEALPAAVLAAAFSIVCVSLLAVNHAASRAPGPRRMLRVTLPGVRVFACTPALVLEDVYRQLVHVRILRLLYSDHNVSGRTDLETAHVPPSTESLTMANYSSQCLYDGAFPQSWASGASYRAAQLEGSPVCSSDTWPVHLRELRFEGRGNWRVAGLLRGLPPNLERLYLPCDFGCPIGPLPASLELLCIGAGTACCCVTRPDHSARGGAERARKQPTCGCLYHMSVPALTRALLSHQSQNVGALAPWCPRATFSAPLPRGLRVLAILGGLRVTGANQELSPLLPDGLEYLRLDGIVACSLRSLPRSLRYLDLRFAVLTEPRSRSDLPPSLVRFEPPCVRSLVAACDNSVLAHAFSANAKYPSDDGIGPRSLICCPCCSEGASILHSIDDQLMHRWFNGAAVLGRGERVHDPLRRKWEGIRGRSTEGGR